MCSALPSCLYQPFLPIRLRIATLIPTKFPLLTSPARTHELILIVWNRHRPELPSASTASACFDVGICHRVKDVLHAPAMNSTRVGPWHRNQRV